MNNQNPHVIMCRALALAACLGVAGSLYYLIRCGVTTAGLVVLPAWQSRLRHHHGLAAVDALQE